MRIANVDRRAGFTLIELLVVIAILAILFALGAGAYFRVTSSQKLRNSEATVKKIETGLEAQWLAVIDMAKDDIRNGKINSALLTAAGNDRDRAAALYTKMKLKVEFPVSFSEVNNPNTSTYGIPAKDVYKQYITGASAGGDGNLESAVCLYMALTQARRGASFNPDQIGAGSVGTITVGGKNFQVFLDAWGTPIQFDRWTSRTDILQEMNNAPYVSDPSAANRDPQDPLDRLRPWASNWTNEAAVPRSVMDGQNRIPTVRSAGPDKIWYKQNTGPVTSVDDIWGFRMKREGMKGN
jgi:prepilin-type N-terminal cleavage/methylation domain-containing protein